jgi:hypothetical protein
MIFYHMCRNRWVYIKLMVDRWMWCISFVYFIFLNTNRFERSVTGNIQDDCCKFVFLWIRICNIVYPTWIVQGTLYYIMFHLMIFYHMCRNRWVYIKLMVDRWMWCIFSTPLLGVTEAMFVYFIFLNTNRFERSVTGNIQDDCCKFVFLWIRICNIVYPTWIVQGM